MAVFRVECNRGYTVMSNHHLRNKELSLGNLSAAAYPRRLLGWKTPQMLFDEYMTVAA